jgi:phosphatidyl-myo-inositol dimannoside synthase
MSAQPVLDRNEDSGIRPPRLRPHVPDASSTRIELLDTVVAPRTGRILLLSQILPPLVGGSSRYFWEIARRIPRDDLVVVTDDVTGATEFDTTHDVNVVRMPLQLRDTGFVSPRGLLGYWRLARDIAAVCRKRDVSAIWCGRCVPEGWIGFLVGQMTGLPYYVSAHGEEVTLPDPDAKTGVMTSRQHRWMGRQVFGWAAGVFANSENTRRILRSSWDLLDSQIITLTPGVDADFYHPVARSAEVRRGLGWGDRPVVLTVGRLHTRKGHDQMIAGLAAVRRRMPDVLYAVVGDGPERSRLARLAHEHGVADHVRFHGEADERTVLRCYQQCDLFVLPNRQVGSEIEGFGMVLLEAEACGRPVVAGASGGTAETMRQPDTGVLVDCTDPHLLAEVVADLLADPTRRAAMGRAARVWAADRFGWGSLAVRAADRMGRGRR